MMTPEPSRTARKQVAKMLGRWLNRPWERILPLYATGHLLGATFANMFRLQTPPRRIAVYVAEGPDHGVLLTLATLLFLASGGGFGAALGTKLLRRHETPPSIAPWKKSSPQLMGLIVAAGALAGFVPPMIGLASLSATVGPIEFWPPQDDMFFPSYNFVVMVQYALFLPLVFLACALLGFAATMGIAGIYKLAKRLGPSA
jgi:hypothetical protein